MFLTAPKRPRAGGHLRRSAIGALLLCLFTGACQRPLEKHAMATSRESIPFELPSGVVVVDIEALEEMKTALQAFIDGPAYPVRLAELRDGLRAEMETAAVWISGGLSGVGTWHLENDDGQLILIRYAPPANAGSYQYLARLERAAAGWMVIDFEQRRELGPR